MVAMGDTGEVMGVVLEKIHIIHLAIQVPML